MALHTCTFNYFMSWMVLHLKLFERTNVVLNTAMFLSSIQCGDCTLCYHAPIAALHGYIHL